MEKPKNKNIFRYSVRATNQNTIEYIKKYFTPEKDNTQSYFQYIQKGDENSPYFILIESTDDILIRILRKRLDAEIKILK